MYTIILTLIQYRLMKNVLILMRYSLQVCEVYRLHRETFYLSVDFIDRFLCTTDNVMKHQLQLVGITALFIAAKLEVLLLNLINIEVIS